MNDSLFDLPESKSPRLIWMEENQIRCDLCKNKWPNLSSKADWVAWTPKKGTKSESILVFADTELDAIADLARKLSLKLWNEQ